MAIQTEKLTKSYGKARGIIDVDLRVEKGDFYGFIGPNGAGKSTTIRTLLGLLRPNSGSARVLGLDVATEKQKILSRVGYLPADAALYRGMRVRDVLTLSAGLRGLDCSEEAARLCERLELDTTRRTEELSLGNRKKVGIVCALQHNPELLVLDEPTSGLDPLVQREFYSILKERNAAGATVFLSSHVLSEVGRYCTHAAVIREGRILHAGHVDELVQTGVKRVQLRGVGALPQIEHAKDIKLDEGTLQFLYTGKTKQLLSILAAMDVTDVTITDPDLEDVFLHFYEKGGN